MTRLYEEPVIAFQMGRAELVIRENLCTHDWSSKPEAWPQRQTARATARAMKCTILPLTAVKKIPLWDLLSFITGLINMYNMQTMKKTFLKEV